MSNGPCVSNAGPLIHLARISGLELLEKIFRKVLVVDEVYLEAVMKGKEAGATDALLIERAAKEGWLGVKKVQLSDEVMELAERAGIEVAEACSIQLAYGKKLPILLDDAAARTFARGLGLEVMGSIGVLLRALKMGLVSKSEALGKLDELSRVMWLSPEAYEEAVKLVRGWK